MDVMDAHLERHTYLHIVHAHRYGIGTEGKFAVLVHSPAECESDETVADYINWQDRSLSDASQDAGIIQLTLLGFLLLLTLLLAEDDAAKPTETSAYFAHDTELAECGLSQTFAVAFTLFGFSHVFLSLLHSRLDGSLLLFQRLIE